MLKKKVVVIGAGIGGLSAAIRLQTAGYQVSIFEKEEIPGGKMHQIKDKGYTFDVGPTLVMMPSIYEKVFSDAGRNPKDYITMERLTPMYDVYFKDTNPRHYSLTTDLTDWMKLVEKKGEKNAAGFLNYLSSMYQRYQVAVKYFITRPFRNAWDSYQPFMLRQILKLKTFDSADKMMAKFMPDSDLQKMLSFQTLYIGVSPKKGPSLYNIIPMIELLYGVWFLKGGMHSMAKAMEKLFLEMGGKIFYHSEVEKILIREQKARGIRVHGKNIAADYVVCNADFPYAMTHLVQNQAARGKYSPRKIQAMDYSCSCLVFYWGVQGKFPQISAHTFIISEDLDENLKRIFNGQKIEDPSIYLHIPSQVDPQMAPEGHSSFYVLMPISDLHTCRYEWKEETVAEYREKALRSLELLPGLKSLREKITLEHVFTPHDFAERFHAYRGATFGLQPTLLQSNHFRPQAKAKACDCLYFTGSSTHPGAGVPIVIESGRICAEELQRDDRKELSL